MTTNSLVKNLKENNQDFEWYPTTDEIIEVVCKDLASTYDYYFRLLDVGAGDGRVLNKIEKFLSKNGKVEVDKYAIEKSKILVNQMSDDVMVIGSDFNEQSFIDKSIDFVFCNPPYSEYEEWTKKLLIELNCKKLYMVIPERWKDNNKIKETIDKRNIKYDILGSFDFLAADRKARANVDIVCFDMNDTDESFDLWFDTYFKINADKDNMTKWNRERKKQVKLENEIIEKENLIPLLVKIYDKDLQHLLNNYKTLEHLDADLFNELDINLNNLKSSLRQKIENLKNFYWDELFNRLDEITNRLISSVRKNILDTLRSNTNIDFTEGNIYNIVVWLLKNANKYFDKQLLEIFDLLSSDENIKLYKSNNHLLEDGWRYTKGNFDNVKYYLDYRIILHGWYAITDSKWDGKNGLHDYAHDRINDIMTVAKNLGFNVLQSSYDFHWSSGQTNNFFYGNKEGCSIFAEVKAFKNGNIHIKFCKEFMKALNIEAGRLKGWIRDKKDVVNEMKDIKENDYDKFVNSNFTYNESNIKALPFKVA